MREQALGLLLTTAGQGAQQVPEAWRTGPVPERETRTSSSIMDLVRDPVRVPRLTQRPHQAVQGPLECPQGCVAAWGAPPYDLGPPAHAPRSQAAPCHGTTRGLFSVACIRLWFTLCPPSPGLGVRGHPKARRHSGKAGLPWATRR